MSLYDSWDGLRLCKVCGDRETQSDICWACRQQEAIDNYDFSGWAEKQEKTDMIELAAFVNFEGGSLVGVIPYQTIMNETANDGVKEDLFPAGWQEESEWVNAEILNPSTGQKYRVTLYIVRDYEQHPFELEMLEKLFEVISKDVVVRYELQGTVEYFNPNPHK